MARDFGRYCDRFADASTCFAELEADISFARVEGYCANPSRAVSCVIRFTVESGCYTDNEKGRRISRCKSKRHLKKLAEIGFRAEISEQRCVLQIDQVKLCLLWLSIMFDGTVRRQR